MSWIGGSWRVMIDGKYVWPALKGNWNKRIHQTLQGNIQTKEINKGLSTSASINCLSTKWRHPFKTPVRYFRAATGIQDFNMPNFSIFPWFAPQVCLHSQSKVSHCSLEIHRGFFVAGRQLTSISSVSSPPPCCRSSWRSSSAGKDLSFRKNTHTWNGRVQGSCIVVKCTLSESIYQSIHLDDISRVCSQGFVVSSFSFESFSALRTFVAGNATLGLPQL